MGSENRLRHVAIIMDGNSRWAKKRGLIHVNGHKAGVERIRDMLTVCRDEGIDALTLFAFSSENWNRPAREVDALMSLFHNYLTKESPRLKEEGIRLRVIGGRDRFSAKILKAIDKAETLTRDGTTNLLIAADYGGKWDICNATRRLAEEVRQDRLQPEQIDESLLDQHLSTAGMPPLDLLIRTGGEYRISNFLLWQAAYAELYFSDRLWPDFTTDDLRHAIAEFRCRQRRFGRTSDQVQEARDA